MNRKSIFMAIFIILYRKENIRRVFYINFDLNDVIC